MKSFCLILILGLCACTNLTRQEQMTLHHLKGQGVTVDRPAGSFEPPAMAVTVPIGLTGSVRCLPGPPASLYARFPPE